MPPSVSCVFMVGRSWEGEEDDASTGEVEGERVATAFSGGQVKMEEEGRAALEIPEMSGCFVRGEFFLFFNAMTAWGIKLIG